MNSKTKKILWIGSGIAISFILLYGVYRLSFKKFIANTPFKRRSIRIAKQEYELWGNGTKKESNSAMYNTIKKYWDSIGWKESQWSPTGTAWSSAFISYVMRKAKAKDDDFKFASKHSVYIRQAIDNRKNKNKGFKGYKLNEKKVELGDLVCRARQEGVTYDTTSDYNSHCDLIVEIDGDKAIGLGGNISNSVGKTNIPLDENGYVKTGNKRFVVIKTK